MTRPSLKCNYSWRLQISWYHAELKISFEYNMPLSLSPVPVPVTVPVPIWRIQSALQFCYFLACTSDDISLKSDQNCEEHISEKIRAAELTIILLNHEWYWLKFILKCWIHSFSINFISFWMLIHLKPYLSWNFFLSLLAVLYKSELLK